MSSCVVLLRDGSKDLGLRADGLEQHQVYRTKRHGQQHLEPGREHQHSWGDP